MERECLKNGESKETKIKILEIKQKSEPEVSLSSVTVRVGPNRV